MNWDFENYNLTADDREELRRDRLRQDMEAAPIVKGLAGAEVLKAKEVAQQLRCHVSTVYDMLGMGRLKGFSLTGNVNKSKRGKKAIRILASSVGELVTMGVAESKPPVEVVRQQPVTKTPSRASRVAVPTTARPTHSRVMLEFPR